MAPREPRCSERHPRIHADRTESTRTEHGAARRERRAAHVSVGSRARALASSGRASTQRRSPSEWREPPPRAYGEERLRPWAARSRSGEWRFQHSRVLDKPHVCNARLLVPGSRRGRLSETRRLRPGARCSLVAHSVLHSAAATVAVLARGAAPAGARTHYRSTGRYAIRAPAAAPTTRAPPCRVEGRGP